MKYRELIKKVQLESGFSDKESMEALNNFTETLAGQLTEDERKDFASQLPAELQDVAMDSMSIERDEKQDLIEYFSDRYMLEKDRAKKQILSTWKVIKEAIEPGEIEDIKSQLPKQTLQLLH